MKRRQGVAWALFAAVAVLAGMKVYTELRLRRIRDTYPPIGRFVPADGIRLHYVRQGTGTRW
ncbi:MAG: hypothetical protein U9R72_10135 [Chloroflexota bacterium]|nr:hypothetical protein [Chloroflexota bacterium]